MKIKTNLLEDDVMFVDITMKQNTNFKIIIYFFVLIMPLFLFFLFFKYLNE